MSYAYGMKGAPAVGKSLGGLPRRTDGDNGFKVVSSQSYISSTTAAITLDKPIKDIRACICTITVRNRATRTSTHQIIFPTYYMGFVKSNDGTVSDWTITYNSTNNSFNFSSPDTAGFAGWSVNVVEYDVRVSETFGYLHNFSDGDVIGLDNKIKNIDNCFISCQITNANNNFPRGNSDTVRLNRSMKNSYVTSTNLDGTYSFAILLNDNYEFVFLVDYVHGFKGTLSIIEWS